MNTFMEGIVTIALAIVTLGMISVIVSRKAQTPAVIQAAGSAFVNALGVAEAPVTGARYNIVTAYPGGGPDFTSSFGYG